MAIAYAYLFLAILAETVGSLALQASQQFTRFGPTAIMGVFYILSLYLMALALKTMNLGVVYAIWSGLDIVSIAGLAYLVYDQNWTCSLS